MQPRTEKTALEGINIKVIITSVVAFMIAIGAEMLAESGFELIDWEAEWAESGTAFGIGMVMAAALAIIILIVMKKRAEAVDAA